MGTTNDVFWVLLSVYTDFKWMWGYLTRCVCGFFCLIFFSSKGVNELSPQYLFGKRSKFVYKTVYLYVFYFSFLIYLPLPLSIIKGRNAPGKPMREVSETRAHSHGFCLSHPAFCVWPLCKNCVCVCAHAHVHVCITHFVTMWGWKPPLHLQLMRRILQMFIAVVISMTTTAGVGELESLKYGNPF